MAFALGVFLGIVALAALWWAFGLRSRLRQGKAGPHFARTHAASQHHS